MAVSLPPDFIRMMQEQYGSDAACALCHALLETEPEVSVRINPRKRSQTPDGEDLTLQTEEFTLTPVPWCREGFYLSGRPPFTMDPLLHAGAYYVQEASSMYLAEILHRYAALEAPVQALDLCAAPGGKSTLVAGLLPEGSTLLCNEPMAKRAQVLSENVQKWTRMREGHYPVRCIVTQQMPADFARFTDCFDLIVTDVPCSGEGMFRKDEEAVRGWSPEAVMRCSALQREIVETVWPTLREGALLVYSTCTFNRFEDEDNVRWICEHLGGTLLEERHFLPGRDRGEGFYVAAIRKESDGALQEVRERQALPSLRTMRVLHDSDEAPLCVDNCVALSYDDALHYLRGEALRLEAPRGPVTLTYAGLVLGEGKSVGSRINNLYPAPWRIRTTYLSRFSLALPCC
ncbi:MAG: hypothetical protein J6X76_03490 [Bacteroidaceae bacterium]|nr:hypothetical protein [Bacteroidaceae bacterium]